MPTKAAYRYLPHTADVEYVAFGKNINEAFGNAALALFNTTAYIGALQKSTGKEKTVGIKAKSDNIEDLVWRGLQLCLSEADCASGYICPDMLKSALQTLHITEFGGLTGWSFTENETVHPCWDRQFAGMLTAFDA